MKTVLRCTWLIVPFVLLIAGVCVYTATSISKINAVNVSPYTVTQRKVYTEKNQQPVVEWTSVRALRSNGEFVERRIDSQGKVVYLAFSHEGKFLSVRSNRSELSYVSDYDPTRNWSEDVLRSDPRLNRSNPTRKVQGVTCYALRMKETDDGNYLEHCLAPGFNFPLELIVFNEGDKETIETVSISAGEPSPDLFENLPLNLPISKKQQIPVAAATDK